MIVFQTKHHADITMFDNVALKLIKQMGHSETVPGAFTEEEVEQALDNLKQAISKPSAQSGDSWDDDSVSLAHRAKPLIDLLETAKQNQEHVIWEKSLT
ncbi:MAG: DUF1840 domain-containing protein [Pseudomonadota bacterium]|nr:DUF1840 domain-containing protein [Pseudomonadota bacterium]